MLLSEHHWYHCTFPQQGRRFRLRLRNPSFAEIRRVSKLAKSGIVLDVRSESSRSVALIEPFSTQAHEDRTGECLRSCWSLLDSTVYKTAESDRCPALGRRLWTVGCLVFVVCRRRSLEQTKDSALGGTTPSKRGWLLMFLRFLRREAPVFVNRLERNNRQLLTQR